MQFTTRRRRAVSTLLAVFLAIESVSAVAAAAQTTVPGARDAVPAAAAADATLAGRSGLDVAINAAVAHGERSFARAAAEAPDALLRRPNARTTVSSAPVPARAARVAARTLAPPVAAPRAGSASSSRGTASSGGTRAVSSSRSYSGRNHVWIPALGINRSVAWFPCSRTREPGNYVYRWGCAGGNNVYLLGHAYSVFKPLHDAYVNGRLRKGMRAIYADAKGQVHTYAVKWWKTTRPTNAGWAWAGQSVPSMTLQTCVGRNSEYRLIVRLVEIR